jgi:hypothetical protein
MHRWRQRRHPSDGFRRFGDLGGGIWACGGQVRGSHVETRKD